VCPFLSSQSLMCWPLSFRGNERQASPCFDIIIVTDSTRHGPEPDQAGHYPCWGSLPPISIPSNSCMNEFDLQFIAQATCD